MDHAELPRGKNMTDDPNDNRPDEFKLWPPSPKTQIILIAVAFGLFNAILLAIWAAVMIWKF
jgi:hypothetical protein